MKFANMTNSVPLAERMRPRKLSEFVGHEQLTGKSGSLRESILSGKIFSMLFWGNPGVGKTALANVLANETGRPFYHISAINSGVKDIRKVFEQSEKEISPILFIDEIHRFNKAQQDSLLGAVEKGEIILIGATTENPSFEVIPALLSRCQVYILHPLSKIDLLKILQNALEIDIVLKEKKIVIKEDEAMLRLSGGDARKLLTILDIIVESENTDLIEITNQKVLHYSQTKMALYDKSGENHYDIISAFIKSMRGSDPNGAVYWLARMIEGGEDPKFIARRMVIFSSEDIGNANPNALLLATSCFQAVNMIGYPEARIILSHTCCYLASSLKSNASYMAIEKAMEKVKESGDLPVPLHIRNAPTRLMKEIGYGKGYDYAHSHEGHFYPQEYLPAELKGTCFYEPTEIGNEKAIKERLESFWKEKYKV